MGLVVDLELSYYLSILTFFIVVKNDVGAVILIVVRSSLERKQAFIDLGVDSCLPKPL